MVRPLPGHLGSIRAGSGRSLAASDSRLVAGYSAAQEVAVAQRQAKPCMDAQSQLHCVRLDRKVCHKIRPWRTVWRAVPDGPVLSVHRTRQEQCEQSMT